MEKLIRKFEITKVRAIVPGGETGQDSIYNGLIAVENLYPKDSCVLIHDGVRPLITEQTVSDNIEAVRLYQDGGRFGNTFSKGLFSGKGSTEFCLV